MATGKNHTGIFKKLLVEFIGQEDPLFAMLEWTAQQMMQIEAEAKVRTRKGSNRSGFSLINQQHFLWPMRSSMTMENAFLRPSNAWKTVLKIRSSFMSFYR